MWPGKSLLRYFAKFTGERLCQSLFFIKVESLRLYIKKGTLTQVFSCEFCAISKNTFFTEHLWETASEDTYYLNFFSTNYPWIKTKKMLFTQLLPIFETGKYMPKLSQSRGSSASVWNRFIATVCTKQKDRIYVYTANRWRGTCPICFLVFAKTSNSKGSWYFFSMCAKFLAVICTFILFIY